MSNSAQDVMNAFIDCNPDCFGDDLILNNGVLYYGSKEWPLAIWDNDMVLVNASRRGNLEFASALLGLCDLRGTKMQHTTVEHLQIKLAEKPNTQATAYVSLSQQLEEEKAAHAATMEQLQTLQLEYTDLQAQLDAAEAQVSIEGLKLRGVDAAKGTA